MSMDGYTMLLIGLAVLTAYMQGRHDGRTKNPTEAALRQAEAAVKSANQAIEAGNAANAIAAAEAAAFKSPVAIGERFTSFTSDSAPSTRAVTTTGGSASFARSMTRQEMVCGSTARRHFTLPARE